MGGAQYAARRLFLLHSAALLNLFKPRISLKPMTQTTTIYIVDDDDAVRESLSFLLETHGYTPQSFVSGDAFLSSDLSKVDGPVLLDVRMPGRDGLEVLKLAKDTHPDLNIVMMSGHADIAMAVRALKNGAADFIEKPFQSKDIMIVLDKLQSPKAATTTPQSASPGTPPQKAARERLARLTARESEVVKHLVAGEPNKGVAHHMGISVRTVETHRAHIMSKLGIRSLSELVKLSMASE